MEDTLRNDCESAILHSKPFGPHPDWHFMWIENPEILASLLELIPGMEEISGTDALLGFARRGSFLAEAETAAALYRVFCLTQETTPCDFSEPLTLYFHIPEGQKIAAAFGVPQGFVCVGALLFSGARQALTETEPDWTVFSYVR